MAQFLGGKPSESATKGTENFPNATAVGADPVCPHLANREDAIGVLLLLGKASTNSQLRAPQSHLIPKPSSYGGLPRNTPTPGPGGLWGVPRKRPTRRTISKRRDARGPSCNGSPRPPERRRGATARGEADCFCIFMKVDGVAGLSQG